MRNSLTETPDLSAPKPSVFADPLGNALSVMNALGSCWIFVLLVLINSDVLGRTLFTRPIDGVEEMIELSLVGIVFLQLGDATRRGRLTRSDGFFNFISRVSPGFGNVLGGMVNLLGAALMVLIFHGSYPLLIDSIELCHYKGNEGIFTAPNWPIKLIVLIGCAVTGLQFLVLAGRSFFFNTLLRVNPGLAHMVGGVTKLGAAAFIFLIFFGSYFLLIDAIELCHTKGAAGVFTAPVWPIKLIFLFGGAVSAWQFVVVAKRFIRLPMGEPKPGDSSG